MRKGLLFIALFFLASCSPKYEHDKRIQASVLSYGLWQPLDSISSEVTLDKVNGLGLTKRTDDIPMEIGSIFLFRWEVFGPDGTYQTEMVQWRPQLVDGEITEERIVQESKFTITDGKHTGYWGHGLFEKSHLIPGEWGYEIYQDGSLLVSQKFYIR